MTDCFVGLGFVSGDKMLVSPECLKVSWDRLGGPRKFAERTFFSKGHVKCSKGFRPY